MTELDVIVTLRLLDGRLEEFPTCLVLDEGDPELDHPAALLLPAAALEAATMALADSAADLTDDELEGVIVAGVRLA